MKGIRTNCNTGQQEIIDLEYEIYPGKGGDIFQLFNGVSGYESFYITDEVIKKMSENGWLANVGTPTIGTAAGWDELFISAEEIKKVFEEEGLL